MNPSPLPPATVLAGRYEVRDVLGQGGFGYLYLAWDGLSGCQVVIKEYMPLGIASRDAEETEVRADDHPDDFHQGLGRFLEEAGALAPFAGRADIASIRDSFREHGTGYIVMEDLEGESFHDLLRRRGSPLPYDEAIRLLLPVMDCLEEIHRQGLLHRDICPDNLFLTRGGQVKILEFGVARPLRTEDDHHPAVIVREGYSPVEQYRRKGRQGPWTDVYAIAATLYHLLTGQVPPTALDRLPGDAIEPPSALGVSMPPGTEAALMRALAVQATERFETMRGFRTSLAELSGPDRQI